jgi:hypothetical protein
MSKFDPEPTFVTSSGDPIRQSLVLPLVGYLLLPESELLTEKRGRRDVDDFRAEVIVGYAPCRQNLAANKNTPDLNSHNPAR